MSNKPIDESKVENCPECESWDTTLIGEYYNMVKENGKKELCFIRKYVCNSCGNKFELAFTFSSVRTIKE